MSLASAGGIFQYPVPELGLSTSGASMTFDGAADLVAAIFEIPTTGTISNVHYRVQSVSSPVCTLRIELRTVNTSTGLPDAAGTLYGSSTSITVANPTTGNKTAAVNCTGATAGNLVALVLDLSAFTSGSFTTLRRMAGSVTASIYPYDAVNTTGSTAVAAFAFNAFALEYGSHVYYPLEAGCVCGTQGTSSTVSNSGTTRRGMRFTAPFTMRAVGVQIEGDLDGNCLLRLRLASNDSILNTATVSANLRGITSAGTARYFFDNRATTILNAGVDYYVLVEGNSATATTVWSITAVEQQQLDQLSGGQTCYGTSYTSGYTDVTTQRYGIYLLFDQVDNGNVATVPFTFGGI